MIVLYLTVWFMAVCLIMAIPIALESGWGVALGIILSVALLAPCFLSIPITTTKNGEHTGYVTAIQQTGMIWKNNYVYMKTENSSSQEDIYCLPATNTELADGLRAASKDRAMVTIRYDATSYAFLAYDKCSGDTITSFERRQ